MGQKLCLWTSTKQESKSLEQSWHTMKRDKRVHTITLVCLKIEVTDRNKKDRIKVWEKHIFNFEIWVYFVLKHTYAQLHPSLLYSVAFASSAVNFTVNVPKTENFPLLLSVWPTFIPEELSVLSIIWSFASTHMKSSEQKDAESDKKKARFLRTQFHFYFFCIYLWETQEDVE